MLNTSRYAPLTEYLRRSGTDRVELSLDEVQRIIGAPLPASARTHRAWWANSTTHSHAAAWLDAGYRVSLPGGLPNGVLFQRGNLRDQAKSPPGARQRPVGVSASRTPSAQRPAGTRGVESPISGTSKGCSPRTAPEAVEIGGVRFYFVATLDPDRGPDGSLIQYMPQAAYRNERRLPLNPHGQGPFCRFRIPGDLHHEGVYALTVAGQVKYIGECEDLSRRFGPTGYGSIQPRNCFVGGQSTNCKLNHNVLEAASQGRAVELRFCRTDDRRRLESAVLAQLRPEWNGRFR